MLSKATKRELVSRDIYLRVRKVIENRLDRMDGEILSPRKYNLLTEFIEGSVDNSNYKNRGEDEIVGCLVKGNLVGNIYFIFEDKSLSNRGCELSSFIFEFENTGEKAIADMQNMRREPLQKVSFIQRD